MSAENSFFLENREIRLFKRRDRTSVCWQAEFKIPWRSRPIVKSTRQKNLEAAKLWALKVYPVIVGDNERQIQYDLAEKQLLIQKFKPRIRDAKHKVQQEIMLRVLQLIDSNHAISQRAISDQLKVSIGVINSYFTLATESGWIKKVTSHQHKTFGYIYFLTETGSRHMDQLIQALLQNGLSLFNEIRLEYAELVKQAEDKHWHKILLVGRGNLADIALLELQKSTLHLFSVLDPDATEHQLITALQSCDAVIVADPDQAIQTSRKLAKLISPNLILLPTL